MYKDDEPARDARSHALITEIAELERERVGRLEQDQRLETARRELASLQQGPGPVEDKPPGLVMHLVVFAVTAAASFVGYTLLT